MFRLTLAATLLMLAASCTLPPESGFAGNRASATLRLAGFTEVRLEPRGFDCATEGEPRPAQSIWSPQREGFFFTAKRAGVPVRGAVCSPRNRSTNGGSDYKLLP
ncbi:hypothetical protein PAPPERLAPAPP_04090 [Brevundimonas phage vB_BpoS-Papperlapapp]|uniref:Lipoprotein n=2 Tax=Marchewkavirus TaxID=3425052 RepID=A0A9E7MPU2_9CAUD|nr:hypothetical protein KABACHOK_02470 [Brevundimonas phage vB_BpoS-Kabachok]USN14778.1 hypothetical protein DOMOVOI_03040 [Brevundimonas phage vB_BpoS-Domovoi]USN16150.1 hypothetical protein PAPPERLAPAPP_04090 [Brevundimonas phage vB_BpoS-Papperlapapp]